MLLSIATGDEQPVTLTDEDGKAALRVAAYGNQAQIQPRKTEGDWAVIGDPTEGALIVLPTKGGMSSSDKKPEIVQELPFDADRKAMSVLLEDDSGHRVQYTKGAPSGILDKCASERRDDQVIALTDERRRAITEANVEMASRALRVLALAYRDDSGTEAKMDVLATRSHNDFVCSRRSHGLGTDATWHYCRAFHVTIFRGDPSYVCRMGHALCVGHHPCHSD